MMIWNSMGTLLLAWAVAADAFTGGMMTMVLEKPSKTTPKKQQQPLSPIRIDLDPYNQHVQQDKKQQSPFHKWPSPMMESHGNYREEAFLEDIIGGGKNNNLYGQQQRLPSLPVPSLQETMDRFLPTALPLCENEAERNSLLQAAQEFVDETKELQHCLEQRRDDSQQNGTSWLQHWWNTEGYLKFRDPLPVHVSYFLTVPDDPSLPKQQEEKENPIDSSVSSGLYRAAAAMTAAAEFRKLVCSGQWPCDQADGEPLCSVGYKYFFHACRIPQRLQDKVRIYDPSRHHHCIVASRGYFFAVDFLEEQTGDALPLNVLVERLQQCEQKAQHLEEEGVTAAPQLGWLTTGDRDDWADARKQMVQDCGGASNELNNALSVLESGAFVICLDDDRPQANTDAATEFWDGNHHHPADSHSHLSSLELNRWFDKSVQLVVTKNGKMGLVAEHSMFDGMTSMTLITHMIKNNYRKIQRREKKQPLVTVGESGDAVANPSKQVSDGGVSHIFEKSFSNPQVVSQLNTLVAEAKEKYDTLTNSVQLQAFLFEDYGKSAVKQAGMSPDAYLQMAFQLASHRLFGTQVGTYEATQTRKFLHGRTETTRAVSLQSEAFVNAMDNNDGKDLPTSTKLSLLRQATEAHQKYTEAASNGRGVDRHFLGLSLLASEGDDEEKPLPKLFSHPAFLRSKTWRLSTSSLPYCPGFGPVVPDGIGIGYSMPSSDSFYFVVTALKETKYASQMCKQLQQALMDMRALMEEPDGDEQ